MRLTVSTLLFALLIAAPPAAAQSEAGAVSVPVEPAALDRNPACAPAMIRAQGLVRSGHHVDAHLVAQTMSLLCDQSRPAWDVLDAVALTHLEEHQRAHSLLESIALDPGPLAVRARVLASWVMIKGNLGRPDSAGLEGQDAARIAVFERINAGHSPGSRASELSGALRYEVTTGFKRLQAADTKSPWLAGVLSTVAPGLGQAYAGSWQGAGMSLLLNGLFISATVELARHELYFASATTGTAASIFYVGNILNAVDLTQRYNQGVTSKHRMQLENLLVPESRY